MILSPVTPRHLGIRPDTESSEFYSEPASRVTDLVEHGGAYKVDLQKVGSQKCVLFTKKITRRIKFV